MLKWKAERELTLLPAREARDGVLAQVSDSIAPPLPTGQSPKVGSLPSDSQGLP